MAVAANNGTEVLLVCTHGDCGRRVVLNRLDGLVVLDRGDFFALHYYGGADGLVLTAVVEEGDNGARDR